MTENVKGDESLRRTDAAGGVVKCCVINVRVRHVSFSWALRQKIPPNRDSRGQKKHPHINDTRLSSISSRHLHHLYIRPENVNDYHELFGGTAIDTAPLPPEVTLYVGFQVDIVGC